MHGEGILSIIKSMLQKKSAGFTLIELLVVISIIGLLSSVVMAALISARDNARYAAAKEEMLQFVKVLSVAKGESGKRTTAITGSGCTRCSCSGDIRNISTASACYTDWIATRNKIQTASGGLMGSISNMTRDPWGSPYLLDENDGEAPADPDRDDFIISNGPDGVLNGAVGWGGDGITFRITPGGGTSL